MIRQTWSFKNMVLFEGSLWLSQCRHGLQRSIHFISVVYAVLVWPYHRDRWVQRNPEKKYYHSSMTLMYDESSVQTQRHNCYHAVYYLCVSWIRHYMDRDHFMYAPSQWETTLHCNVVSHWRSAYRKWSLHGTAFAIIVPLGRTAGQWWFTHKGPVMWRFCVSLLLSYISYWTNSPVDGYSRRIYAWCKVIYIYIISYIFKICTVYIETWYDTVTYLTRNQRS